MFLKEKPLVAERLGDGLLSGFWMIVIIEHSDHQE